MRNISRAAVVTVRDPESAEDLDAWGLREPEPVVTADPVLLLEPAPPERIEEILQRLELVAGSYVLVALRSWPGAEGAYEAIMRWLSTLERPVLLLPFQHDQDEGIARLIAARLQPGAARVPPSAYGPREIMGLIKAAHEVLAMRLHALVMSCAVGTTAAGLSYDPKVNAFCHRSGQAVMDLHLIEQGAADDLMEAARHAAARVEQKRQDLIRQAARTFDLLGELCEGIRERR